mmetsp:Transcript_70958/g.182970  ORF Transcript_70958/g.182970 Transcript_70958/m.182970 type:complete len:313 (+) Transcript_70958:47-985(+)
MSCLAAPVVETVLVIGATSRQGFAVCSALQDTGKFHVYGTSRKAPNQTLEDLGVTTVAFKHGDRKALDEALATAKPTMVFLWTDFWNAACKNKELEIKHGKMLIDACAEFGVKYAVLASVADCDTAPDDVQHFKAKLELENYLKESKIPSWSILRPVAFFENYNDPANWNPLTKGQLKGLWRSDLKLKYVACEDIGKAAAVMFATPLVWKGRTLDCASDELTGDEAAEALSEVSGTPCKYSTAMPTFFMKWFMKDLAAMVKFFEEPGYSSDIAKFKKVVPSAMDAKAFFAKTGQWSDGEKFGADGEKKAGCC